MIRNGIGNIRNDAARRQLEVAAGVRREELNNQAAAMGQNMMAQAETLPSGILASSPELQQTAMAMANGGPVQRFQRGGGILQNVYDSLRDLGSQANINLPSATVPSPTRFIPPTLDSYEDLRERAKGLGINLPVSTAEDTDETEAFVPSVVDRFPFKVDPSSGRTFGGRATEEEMYGSVSGDDTLAPEQSFVDRFPFKVDPSSGRKFGGRKFGGLQTGRSAPTPDFIVDDETSAPAVNTGNMQFVPEGGAFASTRENIEQRRAERFDDPQINPESLLSAEVEITPEFVAQRDAMESRLQRQAEQFDDPTQEDVPALVKLKPTPKKEPSKQDGPPLKSQIGTEVVNQAAGDSAIIKAENLGELVTKARENLVKAESAVAGIENASSKEKQNAFEKLVNMIDEKIPKKKNLQEYVKDIDEALTKAGYEKPKEKTINGYNIAMIGFLIGSGKSPNALQNIVEGLGQGTKLLIKEEEKRKKERLERTKLVTGKALEAEAADTARRLSLINTKFGVMKAEISAAANDKRAQRTSTNRLVTTGLSALLQQQLKNIPATSDRLKILRAAAASGDPESFNKTVKRFGPNFESFLITFDSKNPESLAAAKTRLSSFDNVLRPKSSSLPLSDRIILKASESSDPSDDPIETFERQRVLLESYPDKPRVKAYLGKLKAAADKFKEETEQKKKQ